MFQQLGDRDVWALSYKTAVELMRNALVEHGDGTLHAPPRWRLDAGDGELVFTAGTAAEAGVSGVRIYETFPTTSDDHTALTAVWDAGDGRFHGSIVGHAIGILRTGGLGGVAVDLLSRDDADTVAVLGSGPHARAQLEATAVVRDIDAVAVYSPTATNRETFARTVDDRLSAPVVAVERPETAVDGADVVLCATDSTTAVFETDWLAPGAHVTTLGQKRRDSHEIPADLSSSVDVVVTDSLVQMAEIDDPVVEPTAELGAVVVGDEVGRSSDDEITLYCSVGLAGTEVVLASELLKN